MEIKQGTECTKEDLINMGCKFEYSLPKMDAWSTRKQARKKKNGKRKFITFMFFFNEEEGIVRGYGPKIV